MTTQSKIKLVLKTVAERDRLKEINAELLEALQEMVETYGDEDRNIGKAIQWARAVIKKAIGG